MIADAEKLGDFKAILCWDQDRFGTILAARGHPTGRFRWSKAGIKLVTVSKGAN